MSVDLGDLERLEADSILGVAKPGRREVDAKPAAKLQQRTCADGLGAQVAREERSAFSTSDVDNREKFCGVKDRRNCVKVFRRAWPHPCVWTRVRGRAWRRAAPQHGLAAKVWR